MSVIAGPEIDDKLLSEFLDDDGVDVVVAKFIKVQIRTWLIFMLVRQESQCVIATNFIIIMSVLSHFTPGAYQEWFETFDRPEV